MENTTRQGYVSLADRSTPSRAFGAVRRADKSTPKVRLTKEQKGCENMLMRRQMNEEIINPGFKSDPDQNLRLSNCFRNSYSNPTNMERARENLAESARSEWSLSREVGQSIGDFIVESLVEASVRRVCNRRKRVKRRINSKFFKSLISGNFCSSKFQKGIRILEHQHDCIKRCWFGRRQEGWTRKKVSWTHPVQNVYDEGGAEKEESDGEAGEEETGAEHAEGGDEARGGVPDEKDEGGDEEPEEGDQDAHEKGGRRDGRDPGGEDQTSGDLPQEGQVNAVKREGREGGKSQEIGNPRSSQPREGGGPGPVSDKRGEGLSDLHAGRGGEADQNRQDAGSVSFMSQCESVNMKNIPRGCDTFVLELIDSVTERSVELGSKMAERGDEEKAKFSKRDSELMCENLETISPERMWSPDRGRQRGEERK